MNRNSHDITLRNAGVAKRNIVLFNKKLSNVSCFPGGGSQRSNIFTKYSHVSVGLFLSVMETTMNKTTTRVSVMLVAAISLFGISPKPAIPSLVCVRSFDQPSATALHEAAKRGDAARIKHLIRIGSVDVDHSQKICGYSARGLSCRLTPLHLAVRSGSIEAVKALLDAGFDVDAKYKMAHQMANEIPNPLEQFNLRRCLSKIGAPLLSAAHLQNVLLYGPEYQFRLIKLLLKAGAEPNNYTTPSSYHTQIPLFWVLPVNPVKARNIDAARLLLESGADPKRVFEIAISTNNKEVLEIIYPFCRTSGRC